MNSNSLFSEVRQVAIQMAIRHADEDQLHVDVTSLKLIAQSAPFSWVASFDACTRGGKQTQFFVNVSRDHRNLVVARVPYMNGVECFDLAPYLVPLPAKPKDNGQLAGEAAYANWQKSRGCECDIFQTCSICCPTDQANNFRPESGASLAQREGTVAKSV